MTPELREFVNELKRGRSEEQAFQTYCWASMAIPVWLHHHDQDPFEAMPVDGSRALELAAEAFKNGEDEVGIYEAFKRGSKMDKNCDYVWRVMLDHERPTQRDLVRSLSKEERDHAVELLGIKAVIRAMLD